MWSSAVKLNVEFLLAFCLLVTFHFLLIPLTVILINWNFKCMPFSILKQTQFGGRLGIEAQLFNLNFLVLNSAFKFYAIQYTLYLF